MNRLLKKRLARFLPRRLIDLYKQRFESTFDNATAAERKLVLDETPSAIRCTVDDTWSFLAPPPCRANLVYFTTTLRGQTEFDALVRAAEAGGIIFDIGAHAGITSALVCAGNPRNRVFSFEPSPILREQLAEICRLNHFEDRMSIEASGIGEKPATVEMLIDPVGGFVQTQRFEHTMWAEPVVVPVQIESIESAASRLGVIPDFIKIDVEGYEYEAIQGSLEFLKCHQPKIFLEIHLSYLAERKLPAKALVEMLRGCGYTLFSYAGSPLHPRQIYHSPLSNVHVVARKA